MDNKEIARSYERILYSMVVKFHDMSIQKLYCEKYLYLKCKYIEE